MRGAIHGVWLVSPDGKLHKAIIPTLSSWVPVAAESDFHVILWTNIDNLAQEDIVRLNDAKIKIGDPREFKNSPLYKYYDYFLEKGINGDTTAFALASDILRMAILDFTANDKYFIYVDPNDINLLDLGANLQMLDSHMQNNAFGYSFPVGPVAGKPEVFDIRNDVLIALKAKNPEFFKDYLTAYWTNLDQTYKRYEKPTSDAQAKFFATRITNQTSTLFFRLESAKDKPVTVVAQFADYSELYQAVNSNMFLNYKRVMENGNTWAPVGTNFDVQDELTLNTNFLESLVAEQKEAAKTVTANENKTTTFATYAIIPCVLLLLVIAYSLFRRRFTSKV